jgi:hypothetical protein
LIDALRLIDLDACERAASTVLAVSGQVVGQCEPAALNDLVEAAIPDEVGTSRFDLTVAVSVLGGFVEEPADSPGTTQARQNHGPDEPDLIQVAGLAAKNEA